MLLKIIYSIALALLIVPAYAQQQPSNAELAKFLWANQVSTGSAYPRFYNFCESSAGVQNPDVLEVCKADKLHTYGLITGYFTYALMKSDYKIEQMPEVVKCVDHNVGALPEDCKNIIDNMGHWMLDIARIYKAQSKMVAESKKTKLGN